MERMAVDAAMGDISPNGKYLAYVEKGPYLVVSEFNGDEVLRVPWGVRPVWSPDGSKIYYAKLEEKTLSNWDDWWRHVESLCYVSLHDGKTNTVMEGKIIPGDFCPTTGLLAISRAENTANGLVPYIHHINVNNGLFHHLGLMGHSPIYSSDGFLSVAGPNHSMALVQFGDKAKTAEQARMKVSFVGEKVIPTGCNKTGSFLIFQKLEAYAKVDPRDETKYYWRLYVVDLNDGSTERFIDKFFSFSEARFRRGGNDLILTSDLRG